MTSGTQYRQVSLLVVFLHEMLAQKQLLVVVLPSPPFQLPLTCYSCAENQQSAS
jgi:hypothetical protein